MSLLQTSLDDGDDGDDGLDGGFAALDARRTLTLSRLLPGPVERVWRYLTEAELRRQWLAGGEMKAEEGARFELVWRNDELTDPPGRRPEGFGEEHRMDSRVLACEPPHRLSFTWGADGRVTFELAPRGTQVLLTITHEGIGERPVALMIGAGWHMHVDVLAAKLEGRRGEPFWDGWVRLREAYDVRLPA